MRQKIINCLNNENGGPNVENIVSIAVAMAILVQVFKMARAAWAYYHIIPSTIPGIKNISPTDSTIIVGYKHGNS